jgi:hypothetical protein
MCCARQRDADEAENRRNNDEAGAEPGKALSQRGGHARIVEQIGKAEDENSNQERVPGLVEGLGEDRAQLV